MLARPVIDGELGSFAELLRLVATIDGIDRIRFTTSHPIEFTDDIIEVYRDTPELVGFLHLPVQSGSDRVLNMMGRTHTALEYKAITRKLRAANAVFKSALTLLLASRVKLSTILSKP